MDAEKSRQHDFHSAKVVGAERRLVVNPPVGVNTCVSTSDILCVRAPYGVEHTEVDVRRQTERKHVRQPGELLG